MKRTEEEKKKIQEVAQGRPIYYGIGYPIAEPHVVVVGNLAWVYPEGSTGCSWDKKEAVEL